jgi:hypothetical protein
MRLKCFVVSLWLESAVTVIIVLLLLVVANKQYLMGRRQSVVASPLFSVSVFIFTVQKLYCYMFNRTVVTCLYFTAQFAQWSFGPQHGFARIIRWNLEKAPERLPSGDVEAIFSIMDSEFTRSMWNYP